MVSAASKIKSLRFATRCRSGSNLRTCSRFQTRSVPAFTNERVTNETVTNERVMNERVTNERVTNETVPNETVPNKRFTKYA